MKNIPKSIESRLWNKLYHSPNHPIKTVWGLISSYFKDFNNLSVESPYTSVEHNFDLLRIPSDHPSRSSSDTFYDGQQVLRTHMTCHLPQLGNRYSSYIIFGDVYRKDAIDATHYPIFHQIDGFKLMEDGQDPKEDLRKTLTGLSNHLFNADPTFLEDKEYPEVYFPFTVDSLEAEVEFNGKKMEILGGGTVHPEIMDKLGLKDKKAWAFGLGIERLAMALFEIPDIRLFWTSDPRFLSQFKPGKISKFVPYSKYQECWKDISFWISDTFSYNDFCTLIRDLDRDNLIESVTLKDSFEKTGKTSHCYRITYRSMNETLENSTVNEIQEKIRAQTVDVLKVEMR